MLSQNQLKENRAGNWASALRNIGSGVDYQHQKALIRRSLRPDCTAVHQSIPFPVELPRTVPLLRTVLITACAPRCHGGHCCCSPAVAQRGPHGSVPAVRRLAINFRADALGLHAANCLAASLGAHSRPGEQDVRPGAIHTGLLK